MKKNIAFLLILGSLFQSCSLSNSSNQEVTKSDDFEFAVDTFVEDNAQEFVATAEVKDDIGSVPAIEDYKVATEIAVVEEKPAKAIEIAKHEKIKEAPEMAIQKSLEAQYGDPFEVKTKHSTMLQEYVVQKGDTLMMIAFKIYGDYGMWKEIKKLNRNVKHLSEGTVLSYHVPSAPFGWEPTGNPYLIKRGETLGSISFDLYHTSRKWRSLYEHNKPLIKDPNLIFAGFTIYYQPDRDLASKAE